MKTPFDDFNEPDEKIKCPECGASMLLKVNGATGVEFYGCSAFPECKGKRGKVRVNKDTTEQSINCLNAKLDLMMHILNEINQKLGEEK